MVSPGSEVEATGVLLVSLSLLSVTAARKGEKKDVNFPIQTADFVNDH